MAEKKRYSAFVLHSRPYKESAALVDIFTPQGRMRGVVRQIRTKSGSLVQPFIQLELQSTGRGELKAMSNLEAIGPPIILEGRTLFSALYLNELLMRLLPTEDAHPNLFILYTRTIFVLAKHSNIEPLLRNFEWQLLQELGYGFALHTDVHGNNITPTQYYQLVADIGLTPTQNNAKDAFQGAALLDMAKGIWTEQSQNAAKRLMRVALAAHLGTQPLMSRTLFNVASACKKPDSN